MIMAKNLAWMQMFLWDSKQSLFTIFNYAEEKKYNEGKNDRETNITQEIRLNTLCE